MSTKDKVITYLASRCHPYTNVWFFGTAVSMYLPKERYSVFLPEKFKDKVRFIKNIENGSIFVKE